MLIRKALSRLALLAAALLCVAAVFALRHPKIRSGLAIVRLKATGSLSEIGWDDLYKMIRSGAHFNLPALADSPNPFAAIRNPYNSSRDLAAGGEAYRSHCEDCHGAAGAGGPGGPSLVHRHMLQGSSDWALFRTISQGIHGTAMPASDLPWLTRWQLAAYVRSLMLLSAAPEDLSAAKPKVPPPVSYDDIRLAERYPDQWLTYSGTYDGHRFSSLQQITAANASGLRLLWMRQYDTSDPSVETSPLVVGGYMFITLPPNLIEALDAKTGELLWTYDRPLPDHLSLCCGYANRGLAVLGRTLYLGTVDAHLVALDLETGVVRWDVEIADYRQGYSITSAPLALKNRIVTGIAGGEFGIRGFITARDAETGKEIWRFNTVPQPGQPGADTWDADSWKTGGVPTWLTGSFDPQSNLIFWPTGNPSPNFEGKVRQGDNLYSNSVVALDADHGALQWYFQFTPHDVFDWDATEVLIAFDKDVAGTPKHYLAQANRNGFYYLLDRDTGHFLLARPFAQQTWAKSIDEKGRPIINLDSLPSHKGTVVYPGVGGATNWESPSYNPQTGLIYVPSLDRGGVFYEGHTDYRPGELFLGGSFEFVSGVRSQGAVRALDALTGEQRWEYRNPAFHVGGLLSTGGGVLFGSQQDFFFALNAKTGKELWRVHTSGRIVAAPVTFMNNGKQMVTIAAGHDILTFGL